MLNRPLRTELLFHTDAQTPIGCLTLAGFIKNSAGVRGTPRVLGSYALVYLLEGKGLYQDVRGQHRRVSVGDLLLIFPELGHTYGPIDDEQWSEFYCVFEGRAFDMLRTSGLFSPSQPVLHLQPIAYWLDRLETTIPRRPADTLTARTIDMSRFFQLFTEIVAVGAPTTTAAVPDWIIAACRMLRERLDADLAPPELARQLGIPYETFRKRFQHYVGVSPGRYRTACRIDAACGLLQSTTLTSQKIAVQLGFADEFHFSRRFKQITGVTPRAFRRQLPQLRTHELDEG